MASQNQPLLNRFQAFILENSLFMPTDTLLLAVSGGVDSMVLADLCCRSQYPFAIAHCNFSLRGEESEGDEYFVQKWAEKNHIPFFIRKFDTILKGVTDKISVQMAARTLRYTWFEELCVQNSFSYCALAHHQNDIVETILINLIRGTGIAGLRGILPKSGRFIRPLLAFQKQEILLEAKNRNIPYREDSSNADSKYIRNRLRKEVIPLLKEINPSLENTVTGHLKTLRWAEQLAEEKKQEIRAQFLIQGSSIPLSKISISKILAFGEMGSELLFTLIENYSFTYLVNNEIWNNLVGHTGKCFYSPTHRVLLDREFLFIEPLPSPESPNFCSREEHRDLHSSFKFHWISSREKVDEIKNQILGSPNPPFHPLTSSYPLKFPILPHSAYFDGETLSEPIQFRFWKEGDRFYPLGMDKPKKISDFFIDQKISLFEKSRVPLALCNNEIIWVVGYRMDNRFKVKPGTSRILYLEYVEEIKNGSNLTDNNKFHLKL